MFWLELLCAFMAGAFAHMALEAVLLRRIIRKQQQRALSTSFGAFGGRSSLIQLDAKMRRQFGVGDGH